MAIRFDALQDSSKDKETKISQLKAAISHAERASNEEEVVLLEAELRSVEQGKVFDKAAFLKSRANLNRRPKHRVLADMQSLGVADSVWDFDGVLDASTDPRFKYESSFLSILDQLDFADFAELLSKRALETKRKQNVLDLFGGAYFLQDLGDVSNTVGIRLKNVDEEFAEIYAGYHQDKGLDPSQAKLKRLMLLIANEKRSIIEGDLYKGETWQKLRALRAEKKISSFDLIVCRPEGPFGKFSNARTIKDVVDKESVRGEIYVALLERALSLLSRDGGILFSQIPNLDMSVSVYQTFWVKFIEEKIKEGYEIFFNERTQAGKLGAFAVRRTK